VATARVETVALAPLRDTFDTVGTHALDARVIALFAEAVRPSARSMPDEHARSLGELVARRRQLIDMRRGSRGGKWHPEWHGPSSLERVCRLCYRHHCVPVV
jgi:hypothetical protein